MATTTSTTLSPWWLVRPTWPGSWRPTRPPATGPGRAGGGAPWGGEPSPLDVSFGSKKMLKKKIFPKIVPFTIQRKRYLVKIWMEPKTP
jgi:hypothetical protein